MHKLRFLLLLISMAATAAQAQNYKTALGLRLSSNDATINNSISAKHFFNDVVAIEGLVSFDPVAIGAMGEVHQPLGNTVGLRWLFGGGGFLEFKDGIGAGAQGILGLDYKFSNLPLNLTVDWKPELNFTRDLFFEPAAVGLSVRFTLK